MNRSLTIFRVIINFIIVITNILKLYITYVWTSHSPDKKKEKKTLCMCLCGSRYLFDPKKEKKNSTHILYKLHIKVKVEK